MKTVDIRYLLKKEGYTSAKLATEYGCTRHAIDQTVNGSVRSPGIQLFLSLKLGIDREVLFNPNTKLAVEIQV